jgi:DNA-directed RNA polymerase beta subunit
MTIAYMMEVLMGKVLVEEGRYGDGTAGSGQSITDIAKDLQDNGYHSYGNEIMYNGMTGEQMDTCIFTGPIYYQRLKHMVNDKMHAREMGPPVCLTRQPMDGRAKDGGFRIGEMERDILIGHGTSALCIDRLLNASDKYYMWCCKTCGRIATVNTGEGVNVFIPPQSMSYKKHIYLCRMCGNTTQFARVCVPYACKLFFQELEIANVLPRMITSDV